MGFSRLIVPSERIPRVPHQDQSHICGNAAEIQAALTRLLPASVVEFRRHGNATIPAQTLVSVAMIAWGWLSGGNRSHPVGVIVGNWSFRESSNRRHVWHV